MGHQVWLTLRETVKAPYLKPSGRCGSTSEVVLCTRPYSHIWMHILHTHRYTHAWKHHLRHFKHAVCVCQLYINKAEWQNKILPLLLKVQKWEENSLKTILWEKKNKTSLLNLKAILTAVWAAACGVEMRTWLEVFPTSLPWVSSLSCPGSVPTLFHLDLQILEPKP